MNDFEQYAARAGWRLCAIDRGKKAPVYEAWNTRPIPQDALAGIDGAGLLHVLSGTAALDVDDMGLAIPWLAERDVDLLELLAEPSAVRIESGRPGRTKLLYRLPTPLHTLKPKDSGIELRCATAGGKSMQDVLPPTIHPDTHKPYQWAYGDELIAHWSDLPPLPGCVQALWKRLLGANGSAGPQVPVTAPSAPGATLSELRALLKSKSPDVSYDDWIQMGMRIHHETRGAQEGLDLWIEWDRPVKRVAYPGDAVLKMHWLSFASTPGKRVVTAAGLRREDVATADEFEIVTDEQAAAPADMPTAQDKKKQAIEILEQRLIYVREMDRYLDTEYRDVLQTDHAIQHRFTHIMPRSRGSRVDPVKILRESPRRTMVDGIAFHPGAGSIFNDGPQSFANTYRPLPLELLKPTPKELDYINWLFAKIKDETYREWLLKFLAHIIQKPGVKIRSIPLIWSEITGNGKSTILSTIPRELVGRPYYQEVDYTAIEEKFNRYLRAKWIISLKEFKAGTKAERVAIAQRLKPWITDDTVSLREMRVDTYDIPNRFALTATSNEADAAPIDENDRRWGVYELKTERLTADEVKEVVLGYFNGPRARGTLNHYFRSVSLTGFNPDMPPPETEARTAMIEASQPGYIEALVEAYNEQRGPFVREAFFMRELQDYLRHLGLFVPTSAWLGRWLHKQGGEQRMVKDKELRSFRIWIVRNTDHWRTCPPPELLAYVNGEDFVDPLIQ